MEKCVLCLFEFSDSFAGLYRQLGYKTVAVDLILGSNIFDFDYKQYTNVVGIISHPPCTEFASSGARHWERKDREQPHLLKNAIAMVKKVLEIKDYHKPEFWFIENPTGRLENYVELPTPLLKFHPYEYAGWSDNPYLEAYTKRTILYGKYNIPQKRPIDNVSLKSNLHLLPETKDRAKIRSKTPQGFARAFVAVNQP